MIEKLDGRERVRSVEVEQVSGATDGGGFLGGNAAETEVVQLEGEKRWIACADESPADDLFDGAGKRRDCNGIPDFQENSFGPVGEPIKLGVGVLDGDKRVEALDDGASLTARMRRGRRPPCFA